MTASTFRIRALCDRMSPREDISCSEILGAADAATYATREEADAVAADLTETRADYDIPSDVYYVVEVAS